jgi:hypothetical protein
MPGDGIDGIAVGPPSTGIVNDQQIGRNCFVECAMGIVHIVARMKPVPLVGAFPAGPATQSGQFPVAIEPIRQPIHPDRF